MLPKIALISGLRKFKKSCKIIVVSDERRKLHTVHVADKNWELKISSQLIYATSHFNFRVKYVYIKWVSGIIFVR